MLRQRGVASCDLCSIAVVLIGSIPFLFLVFENVDTRGRNLSFVVHYWLHNSLDGYGQSIQSSHLKTTLVFSEGALIQISACVR